ncbi:hypothetical protein P4531_14235, partial [Geobacillus stearothermophilus]|nr:hypothetical protein [Geobacillus stearothermophilus]
DMNLLVDSWWYIYSNQGIGFMSPFLFSCQFMSVNLLIYSILLEKGRGYQWQKAADQRLFET